VFVLVLFFLGESLAFGAASGSVRAEPVRDLMGRITMLRVSSILYGDDTYAWDYIFAEGSWAKLDCYVDGERRESLVDFVVWYGRNPYDSRTKLFCIDWDLSFLQPGVHNIAFRMTDWYGGYNWVEGNIIAEDVVLVKVDSDGECFVRADEGANY
jgi:hypothetical protein